MQRSSFDSFLIVQSAEPVARSLSKIVTLPLGGWRAFWCANPDELTEL